MATEAKTATVDLSAEDLVALLDGLNERDSRLIAVLKRPHGPALAEAMAAELDASRKLGDKLIAAGNSLRTAPRAVSFMVDGKLYSLGEMLLANSDDAELCDWLKTATPGDVFSGVAVRCACVRV